MKPVRSAKSTVTWRRSASRVGAAGAGGARAARRRGAAFASPAADRRCPQRGQKAKSGEASKPQPVQIMALDAYDSTDEGALDGA